MRARALLALPLAILALTGCGPTASVPPEPVVTDGSQAPSAAPAGTSTSATPSASPAPSLSPALPMPLADAPPCGDGVVLAAAMVPPETPGGEDWLEAGEAEAGFAPAAALDGLGVLCSLTFLTQPDGAQEMALTSQAYVRGDDVEGALRAWAVSAGAVQTGDEPLPLSIGDPADPETAVLAYPLDWPALGENDVDWHRGITGLDLAPTDWVVVGG